MKIKTLPNLNAWRGEKHAPEQTPFDSILKEKRKLRLRSPPYTAPFGGAASCCSSLTSGVVKPKRARWNRVLDEKKLV